MKSKVLRWLPWFGGLLVLVVVAAVGGTYLAAKALKGKIEAALGPSGEVAEIRLAWPAVEIVGLRIKAGKDWPAAEELSAQRVSVTPELASLFSDTIRVASIRVDGAYVSMLRRRDGKVAVLPSLLGTPSAKTGGGPKVVIDAVELTGSAVEFFDATVRQPAHKLRLEQVNVRLGTLRLPELAGLTPIDLKGKIKGVHRDGELTIQGKAEFASKESEVKARLRGIDLLVLQPYLIKASDTGVRKGTLDLDIQSTVRQKRLHAPGSLTLSDLELTGGGFMGLPQTTFVSMLKDKNGRITVNFALDGNLDDPRFSLNETLAGRIGTSLAGTLGVSIEGLAKGVGSAGSSAAKTVGDAVGKLFGK